MIRLNPYLRCVLKNKATLIGYLVATTSIVVFVWLLNYHPPGKPITIEAGAIFILNFVLFYISCILLAMTGFGFETLDAYKRTARYLTSHDHLDDRFANKYRTYCTRMGIELALEEFRRDQAA